MVKKSISPAKLQNHYRPSRCPVFVESEAFQRFIDIFFIIQRFNDTYVVGSRDNWLLRKSRTHIFTTILSQL